MWNALSTFKRSHSKGEELIQSPESKGQDLINIKKESNKERFRPKKETAAERFQPVGNQTAAKPLTCSQNRAIEAQNKDRHLDDEDQKNNRENFVVYIHCPSGSKLSVKKITN